MPKAVTISVVFTDLVGSTEMASRLGPFGAEEIRQIHFGLLRDAVARTEGTEVKNLGDGLMVVYDSLGGALTGAVTMQQSIARHNDGGGEQLGVRIGVSNGDATTEDGDYFGPPVVEAARLCAKAQGGQILTTDVVSILARASGHGFSAFGELELKGIPDPVSAMEVVWSRAADPDAVTVPLPARLSSRVDSGFVGRSAELDLLEGAVKAARAGSRSVVLVAGEPGIGKTRLTSEICRSAHKTGAIVLYGRCDEELGVPFQPWVEAVGHLVDHVSDEVLTAHVASHGGELGRLVPRLALRRPDLPAPRASDPETERYLLFQAVAALIARSAVDAPVVLLLDDLHWADKPTLLLLRHLVAESSDVRLLILGTYRDSEVSKSSALSETLAALRRESCVERVALAGLDDAGVLALLESIAGHAVDEAGVALAHAIGRETSGNPFFVSEILLYLSESGTIYQGDDGRWAVREAGPGLLLPESVREVIGQRVLRLGEDVLRILSAASVIGRDFDVDVLVEVVDESEDMVFNCLEQAHGAALVGEVLGVEDRFTFRHALVQHTLESDLSARQRRRLHERIAEVLEERFGDGATDRVGELATHWLAATTPIAPAKALRYARLAGDQALAQLAPDEAIRWFGAAMDAVVVTGGDDQERCHLLLRLGTAQRHAGDPSYRETLLECAGLAERIGDTASLVSAALLNNRGTPSVSGSADMQKIASLRSALGAVGNSDSPERARLLSVLALELTFVAPFDEREALVAESTAIARRIGDPATLAGVLVSQFYAMFAPQTQVRHVAEINEARSVAAQLGDPSLQFWAAIWCAVSAIEQGHAAEFHARLDEAGAIVRAVRQPLLQWVLTYNRALQAALAADLDESERLATAAMELGAEIGEPDAFTIFGPQLMAVRRVQGRSEELLPLIEQARAASPAVAVYKAVLAANECEAEHDASARRRVEAALAGGFEYGIDGNWGVGLASWAAAAADLQHLEAAEVLFSMLQPYEHLLPVNGAAVMPPFAVNLGELAALLGRLDEADRYFELAEGISIGAEAPYFLARTYISWAKVLHRSGRTDEARNLAEKALHHSGGRFGLIERRAAVLLEMP